MPLFEHRFSPEEQKLVNEYQAVQKRHKVNREMRSKMGERAPQMSPADFKAYWFFVHNLYENETQTLLIPGKNNQPVPVTKKELVSALGLEDVKDEEQTLKLITYLFSLQATHRGSWGPNHVKIYNSYPRDI